MSGCMGFKWSADFGKSRGEAAEGRGEARMKLVNKLGLNGFFQATPTSTLDL